MSTAVEQLREAHTDFIAARYDRTVGACRLALDAVDAALANASQVEQAFKAYESGRRQMTKRQRALLVTANWDGWAQLCPGSTDHWWRFTESEPSRGPVPD